jgi:hypothetical protein
MNSFRLLSATIPAFTSGLPNSELSTRMDSDLNAVHTITFPFRINELIELLDLIT